MSYYAVFKTYWDGSAWQQEQAFSQWGIVTGRNYWFDTHEVVTADLDDDTRPELYFVVEEGDYEFGRDGYWQAYGVHMARFTEGTWEIYGYLWSVGYEYHWWYASAERWTGRCVTEARGEQASGYKRVYVAQYDGKDSIFGHHYYKECSQDYCSFEGRIERFHFDSTFTHEVVHDFGEVHNETMRIVQLKSGLLNHERESVIVCYQKPDSLILWEELSDSDYPWQSVDDFQEAVSPSRDMVRICPNPVHVGAEIHFTAGRDGNVALRICDASGRQVRQLLRDHIERGIHRVTWDGRDTLGKDLPAGAYWVWAVRPDGSVTGERLLLLR
jgi:hypothetical protein